MSDHHFDKVSALLHMDGASYGAIVDETGKTWTAAAQAHLVAGAGRFGTASCYFDGMLDKLTTPDHTDFDMGSGDFTIECWFYENNPNNSGLIAKRTNTTAGWRLFHTSSNGVQVDATIGGTWTAPFLASAGSLYSNSTWNHVAWTRYGNLHTLWLNGQDVDNVTDSGVLTNQATSVVIGATANNTDENTLAGYVDEVRITKGLARYTAEFSVAQGPFANQHSQGTLGDYSQPVIVRGR